ncbi:MAG: beta-lactamase family protein [Polyangiaceae bacterium]|nr:beta-lactamase family protein [Polyangiaceae bacterium]
MNPKATPSRCLVVLALLGLTACSSGPTKAAWNGPPPEYEAPRKGPGSAPATSAAALPDDDDGMDMPPYGSVQDLSASIDAYSKGFGSRYGVAYAPSGVLMISHDGKTIVTRAYGKVKQPDGAAPTAGTRFRIGSVTKPIVATLALKMVEDKTISLSDSVRKWVTELPESYQPITIHHLLSQTSGVASYTEPGGLLDRKMEDVPQKDVLAWLAKKAPDAPDGKTPRPFSYSNSNYYLLGVVLERAGKAPLGQLLSTRVLGPAEMKSAGVDAQANDAVGYMRSPKDELVPADVISPSLPFGAGFLRASAEDLLALDRAYDGTKLLSDASKAKMWTPVSKDYGYGWVVGDIGGSKIEWHNGAIDGFQSFYGRAPDQKVAVVYVGNVFDFDATRFGLDVLKMAMTGSSIAAPVERDTVPVDDAFGKLVAGEYVLDAKSKKEMEKQVPAPVIESIAGITISFDQGVIAAKPTGQGQFPLKRAADGTTLFHPTIKVELAFDVTKKGEKSETSSFTLKQGGIVAKYVRGKAPKPKKPPAKK